MSFSPPNTRLRTRRLAGEAFDTRDNSLFDVEFVPTPLSGLAHDLAAGFDFAAELAKRREELEEVQSGSSSPPSVVVTPLV